MLRTLAHTDDLSTKTGYRYRNTAKPEYLITPITLV